MTDQPRIDAALLTHLGQLAHLQLPAERAAALRAKLQALVAAFSALDDADLGDLGDQPSSAPLKSRTIPTATTAAPHRKVATITCANTRARLKRRALVPAAPGRLSFRVSVRLTRDARSAGARPNANAVSAARKAEKSTAGRSISISPTR